MTDYFLTIILYLIVYISSFAFFCFADKAQKKQIAIRRIVIGVLILSIFAGVRDKSVGTDTAKTITLYFDEAKNISSLGTLFSQFILFRSSFIYLLLAKIVLKAGLGFRTFLTIIQVLTVGFVAACAYYRRKTTPIAITMLLFSLLYYQLSFNWIRQSITCSFLLFAVVLFFEGKKKKSVVIMLISILFHSSAIIGIALFVVILFISRVKKKYLNAVIILLTVILTIIMRNWQTIALIGIERGILPSTYQGYINVFSGAHGSTFLGWFIIGKKAYVEYALRVLMLLFPYLATRRKSSRGENLDQYAFFQMGAFFSVLIYSAALFGLHTAYGNRVTICLDYLYIVYFGLMEYRTKSAKGLTVPLSGFFIILLCLFYNIWLYYVMGWHGTVPYHFSF